MLDIDGSADYEFGSFDADCAILAECIPFATDFAINCLHLMDQIAGLVRDSAVVRVDIGIDVLRQQDYEPLVYYNRKDWTKLAKHYARFMLNEITTTTDINLFSVRQHDTNTRHTNNKYTTHNIDQRE